jgi:MFS family permease
MRPRLAAILDLSRDNRLLAFSLLLWGMGEGLFLYIQPLYLQQLGANPDDIGRIMAAMQLVLALSFIPAGWLADRVGYRAMLIFGWLIGLAALVAMAFAPNLNVFVAGLLIYGFSGCIIPVMSSYITAARGVLSVEQALATVYAAFAMGSIPSPTFGGWIGEQFGLAAVYQAALVFIGVSTVMIFFIGPQRIEHAAGPAGPVVPLWRSRKFIGLGALMFAIIAALALQLPLTPNYLQNVRGISVQDIGALGSLAAVGGIVLQLTLGRGRPQRTLLLAQGLAIVAVGLLWQATWLPLIGLAYFLRPTLTLARLAGSALTARVVEPRDLGMAYGVLETVMSFAATGATFAAGYLYLARPDGPYLAALALLPVLMVISYVVVAREKRV